MEKFIKDGYQNETEEWPNPIFQKKKKKRKEKRKMGIGKIPPLSLKVHFNAWTRLNLSPFIAQQGCCNRIQSPHLLGSLSLITDLQVC